jgi:hypothetical protein
MWISVLSIKVIGGRGGNRHFMFSLAASPPLEAKQGKRKLPQAVYALSGPNHFLLTNVENGHKDRFLHWWARRESNPQGLFSQRILSPPRIPVPPLAHYKYGGTDRN